MSAILLDTTVASLLHPKKRGSSLRSLYEPHMDGQTLVISVQTTAELWAWAEENQWGGRLRQDMENLLQTLVQIPPDKDLARIWAKIVAYSGDIGRKLTDGDAWIAATAVHYELPLLTHDADFVGLSFPKLRVVSYLDS